MACPASMRRAFLEGIARWAGEELARLAADPVRREKARIRARSFLAHLVDGEKRQDGGTVSDPPPGASPSETPIKIPE